MAVVPVRENQVRCPGCGRWVPVPAPPRCGGISDFHVCHSLRLSVHRRPTGVTQVQAHPREDRPLRTPPRA